MKYSMTMTFRVFILICLFPLYAVAQERDSYVFEITDGDVLLTPARCAPDDCVPTAAVLTGRFVAFLPGGATQLFFTSSTVETQPSLAFQLPTDPNEDSGGVSREASFDYDGSSLLVKGVVDARAFDGPLIEYRFSAKVVTKPSDDVAFYVARPDFRKCVSPLCGGYFVKSVNNKRTQCADGTQQNECYVAELNLPVGTAVEQLLRSSTPLFLVGIIEDKKFEGFGNLGVFNAKGAFESATDESAVGTFYGAENNGIMCITSPCFSYDLAVLNRMRETPVSRINFDKVNADAEKIDEAQQLLANGEVLYASGRTYKYKGFAGTGVEFIVQQFYLPIETDVKCEEGYSFSGGACKTPYGCTYPEIQLNGVGGAPVIDPKTGEMTTSITQSCVKTCEFPGVIQEPGICVVYYP